MGIQVCVIVSAEIQPCMIIQACVVVINSRIVNINSMRSCDHHLYYWYVDDQALALA